MQAINDNGAGGGRKDRSSARIESDGGVVRVRDLELRTEHVVDYLDACPDDERPQAVVRAIDVGVHCLERAALAQDLDFVRQRCEAVVHEVTQAAGAIPHDLEAAMLEKLGTQDGQILAPVRQLIERAAQVSSEKLGEVRNTLREELDPARDSSTLGRSLKSVRELLDPEHPRSIQAALAAAVEGVGATDGVLVRCVEQVVAEQLEPLGEEVRRLALEVRGERAAAEALAQTTAKGATFEEQIVAEVEAWAKPTGSEVEHTGPDKKPGDIKLTPTELLAAGGGTDPIIIECRDRGNAIGRKSIGQCLDSAMSERDASAGIFLAASAAGLAKEIGTWAEGRGKRGVWVATTRENLLAAIRMVLMLRRVAIAKEATAQLDETAVSGQLTRIRTALRRVGQITRQVGVVRGGADAIQREGDELRTEIGEALSEIESLVRGAGQDGGEVS